MTGSLSTTDSSTNRGRGILRWAGQMVAAMVIFGAILFLVAGRVNWLAGWVYLGMNAITQILSALVLIPRQGDMLVERSEVRQGTKHWDRILAPAVVIVGTVVVAITAGLDARFGWSTPLNSGLWVLALAIAFASQMFVLWAMASNTFFSTTVRIQADRDHRVARGGPYQLVRHPGYAGSLVYNLAVPLVLGSWWTFIPALVTIILTVIRTGLEDRTLQRELPGYPDYAQIVKYRLVPGVW